MLLAVRISSYGCTWEVWRALKKLELLSAAPRATVTLLSCSPNFPRASITRYTHAKHEPILKLTLNFRDIVSQEPSQLKRHMQCIIYSLIECKYRKKGIKTDRKRGLRVWLFDQIHR